MTASSGLLTAGEALATAAKLVTGDRDRQHGAKYQNFSNIADLWSTFLGVGDGGVLQRALTASDIGRLMVLYKMARTKSGAHNPDDYIDAAGYAGCALECQELEGVAEALRDGNTAAA